VFETELHSHLEKMAEHYHVPVPRLVLGAGYSGELESYYAPKIVTNQPLIFLGHRKGARMSQTKAVLSHEMGHHVHAYTGFFGTSRVSSDYLGSKTLVKEHKAWEIAQPFMTEEKPVQKWVQRYAIGTYLGQI
jgi:hypothetical protein